MDVEKSTTKIKLQEENERGVVLESSCSYYQLDINYDPKKEHLKLQLQPLDQEKKKNGLEGCKENEINQNCVTGFLSSPQTQREKLQVHAAQDKLEIPISSKETDEKYIIPEKDGKRNRVRSNKEKKRIKSEGDEDLRHRKQLELRYRSSCSSKFDKETEIITADKEAKSRHRKNSHRNDKVQNFFVGSRGNNQSVTVQQSCFETSVIALPSNGKDVLDTSCLIKETAAEPMNDNETQKYKDKRSKKEKKRRNRVIPNNAEEFQVYKTIGDNDHLCAGTIKEKIGDENISINNKIESNITIKTVWRRDMTKNEYKDKEKANTVKEVDAVDKIIKNIPKEILSSNKIKATLKSENDDKEIYYIVLSPDSTKRKGKKSKRKNDEKHRDKELVCAGINNTCIDFLGGDQLPKGNNEIIYEGTQVPSENDKEKLYNPKIRSKEVIGDFNEDRDSNQNVPYRRSEYESDDCMIPINEKMHYSSLASLKIASEVPNNECGLKKTNLLSKGDKILSPIAEIKGDVKDKKIVNFVLYPEHSGYAKYKKDRREYSSKEAEKEECTKAQTINCQTGIRKDLDVLRTDISFHQLNAQPVIKHRPPQTNIKIKKKPKTTKLNLDAVCTPSPTEDANSNNLVLSKVSTEKEKKQYDLVQYFATPRNQKQSKSNHRRRNLICTENIVEMSRRSDNDNVSATLAFVVEGIEPPKRLGFSAIKKESKLSFKRQSNLHKTVFSVLDIKADSESGFVMEETKFDNMTCSMLHSLQRQECIFSNPCSSTGENETFVKGHSNRLSHGRNAKHPNSNYPTKNEGTTGDSGRLFNIDLIGQFKVKNVPQKAPVLDTNGQSTLRIKMSEHKKTLGNITEESQSHYSTDVEKQTDSGSELRCSDISLEQNNNAVIPPELVELLKHMSSEITAELNKNLLGQSFQRVETYSQDAITQTILKQSDSHLSLKDSSTLTKNSNLRRFIEELVNKSSINLDSIPALEGSSDISQKNRQFLSQNGESVNRSKEHVSTVNKSSLIQRIEEIFTEFGSIVKEKTVVPNVTEEVSQKVEELFKQKGDVFENQSSKTSMQKPVVNSCGSDRTDNAHVTNFYTEFPITISRVEGEPENMIPHRKEDSSSEGSSKMLRRKHKKRRRHLTSKNNRNKLQDLESSACSEKIHTKTDCSEERNTAIIESFRLRKETTGSSCISSNKSFRTKDVTTELLFRFLCDDTLFPEKLDFVVAVNEGQSKSFVPNKCKGSDDVLEWTESIRMDSPKKNNNKMSAFQRRKLYGETIRRSLKKYSRRKSMNLKRMCQACSKNKENNTSTELLIIEKSSRKVVSQMSFDKLKQIAKKKRSQVLLVRSKKSIPVCVIKDRPVGKRKQCCDKISSTSLSNRPSKKLKMIESKEEVKEKRKMCQIKRRFSLSSKLDDSGTSNKCGFEGKSPNNTERNSANTLNTSGLSHCQSSGEFFTKKQLQLENMICESKTSGNINSFGCSASTAHSRSCQIIPSQHLAAKKLFRSRSANLKMQTTDIVDTERYSSTAEIPTNAGNISETFSNDSLEAGLTSSGIAQEVIFLSDNHREGTGVDETSDEIIWAITPQIKINYLVYNSEVKYNKDKKVPEKAGTSQNTKPPDAVLSGMSEESGYESGKSGERNAVRKESKKRKNILNFFKTEKSSLKTFRNSSIRSLFPLRNWGFLGQSFKKYKSPDENNLNVKVKNRERNDSLARFACSDAIQTNEDSGQTSHVIMNILQKNNKNAVTEESRKEKDECYLHLCQSFGTNTESSFTTKDSMKSCTSTSSKTSLRSVKTTSSMLTQFFKRKSKSTKELASNNQVSLAEEKISQSPSFSAVGSMTENNLSQLTDFKEIINIIGEKESGSRPFTEHFLKNVQILQKNMSDCQEYAQKVRQSSEMREDGYLKEVAEYQEMPLEMILGMSLDKKKSGCTRIVSKNESVVPNGDSATLTLVDESKCVFAQEAATVSGPEVNLCAPCSHMISVDESTSSPKIFAKQDCEVAAAPIFHVFNLTTEQTIFESQPFQINSLSFFTGRENRDKESFNETLKNYERENEIANRLLEDSSFFEEELKLIGNINEETLKAKSSATEKVMLTRAALTQNISASSGRGCFSCFKKHSKSENEILLEERIPEDDIEEENNKSTELKPSTSDASIEFSEVEGLQNFLTYLGFNENRIKDAFKDEDVKNRLCEAINEARNLENKISKTEGMLLYLASSKINKKTLCHFFHIVEAVVKRRILDSVKLDAVLQMLEKTSNKGIHQFDEETRVKNELLERFFFVYNISRKEAINRSKELSKESVNLLRILVAKYRTDALDHLEFVAKYIGQQLLINEQQLADAMTYFSRLETTEVKVDEFEEYCDINPLRLVCHK